MRTQPFPNDAPPGDQVARLAGLLSLPVPIAEWLWRRGIQTQNAWEQLTVERALSSPFLLPDMELAVSMILKTLAEGQRVRIHGDYDADGITATAVMLRGLKALDPTAQVDSHIPNRFDEGYGLGSDAVAAAAEDGVKLLITVDCGSSSQEAAALANRLGLMLIITDHHALSTPLPQAHAIVNPERMPQPNRFSGAGVALQLIRALSDRVGVMPPKAVTAIAAIGTVADVVPLTGDNRILVRQGLALLRAGEVHGVTALARQAKRSPSHLSASDLGFYIGPRLNAVGRMADARPAVNLLLSDAADQHLETLVAQIEAANTMRRRVEQEVLAQAWDQLQSDYVDPDRLPPFIVVGGDGWHQGVLGIVASRLKERLHSPVAVIGWEDEEGKGSARSVPGLNLVTHLRAHESAFRKLGGHQGAAGFSLRRQSLVDMANRLSAQLPASVHRLRYQGPSIDGVYASHQIDGEVLEWLDALEPTGHGFEAPKWMIRGPLAEVRRIGGDGSHLRLRFRSASWSGVAFQQGSKAESMTVGMTVWTFGEMQSEVWNGSVRRNWRAQQVISEPQTRDPAGRLRFEGPPATLSGRVLFIVDSQNALVAHHHQQHLVYDWNQPMALRALADAQIKTAPSVQFAFSQWRPWPEWLALADHVVWLCTPMHRKALSWAAALLTDHGTQWLDPVWLSPDRRRRLVRKWQRLVPDRSGLAQLWRTLQHGHSPLWAGQAVFKELGLNPQQPSPTVRRDLMDSPSYRGAWNQRQSAEADMQLDAQTWAIGGE